jgi:predicted regulator of Ras-like GTPase activity (Roadblock/LC7/MglB family)
LTKQARIETSAIASRDGLLICSTLTGQRLSEGFVAMSATMMGAAETAATELGMGIPDKMIIEIKKASEKIKQVLSE